MGADSWNHAKFLHHKVRNILRRGYLMKTYYDKKLMQARIKTGDGIENDRLDIMHPVGFLGRVKEDEKAEVFTMDVGGDPSRRVVMNVLGDREHHPKIDEGESILYSPGDKSKFIRVRKGGQNSRADAGYGENRAGGIEIDGGDVPISTKTQKTITTSAEDNIITSTTKAIVQKAGQGISRKGERHNFDGDVNIKGNLYITGEGYKPSDGAWKAGQPTIPGVPRYEGEMIGVPDLEHVPVFSIDTDGTVVFHRPVRFKGDVVIDGDLTVNGAIKFLREP